jgi:hypothetical protein
MELLDVGRDGRRHDENWWSGALMSLEMKEGKFTQMKLHPVEMGRLAREGTIIRRTGQGEHALTEGRPLIAHGETAERALGRIQRLSKNYGTDMKVTTSLASSVSDGERGARAARRFLLPLDGEG